MALCRICQNILEAFFAPNTQLILPHYLIDSLRQSAMPGCTLCRIVAAGNCTSYADETLPPENRAYEPTRSTRAIIDPEQALTFVWARMTPVIPFLYHVPRSFAMFTRGRLNQRSGVACADLGLDPLLPRAELDTGVDELRLMKAGINECSRSHPACAKDPQGFL